MKFDQERTEYFKKDKRLEEVLKEINDLTGEIFPSNLSRIPSRPIVLIMGCPRSGSTLLLQWLASLKIFSYPSNLIARFYKNPWLGIKIQQALIELDPNNQLDINQDVKPFQSILGRTKGALEPSEYWYFWREYFKNMDEQVLDEDQLLQIDSKDLLRKLSAFSDLTGKPLVMKGNLMNNYIEFLYGSYNKFIFIHLERDAYYNAQSLFFARKTFFNDHKKWYSAKPKEFTFLKDEDPITQVAGQVVFINNAINKLLERIPGSNVINLSYEAFCKNPYELIEELKNSFQKLGDGLNTNELSYDRSFRFKLQNDERFSSEEGAYLRQKLKEFKDYY